MDADKEVNKLNLFPQITGDKCNKWLNLRNEGDLEGVESFRRGVNKSSIFEGEKGQVLFELQKSYQGDERFKLKESFVSDVDITKLPLLLRQKFMPKMQSIAENTTEKQTEDDLGIEDEKKKAFRILSTIVPQSEVYVVSNKVGQEKQANQALLIPRYDPLIQDSHKYLLKPEVQNTHIQSAKGTKNMKNMKNKDKEGLDISQNMFQISSGVKASDKTNIFYVTEENEIRDRKIEISNKWKNIAIKKGSGKDFSLFGDSTQNTKTDHTEIVGEIITDTAIIEKIKMKRGKRKSTERSNQNIEIETNTKSKPNNTRGNLEEHQALLSKKKNKWNKMLKIKDIKLGKFLENTFHADSEKVGNYLKYQDLIHKAKHKRVKENVETKDSKREDKIKSKKEKKESRSKKRKLGESKSS